MSGGLSDRVVVAIAVAVVVLVLAGEILTFSASRDDFSATTSSDGDTVEYEIVAEGTKEYAVVVNDNSGGPVVSELYVYLDSDYGEFNPTGFDTSEYVDQVIEVLKVRGFTDVEVFDADGLAEVILGDMETGSCNGRGLLVVSGVLPDTVYSGTSNSPILEWIASGGSLYWAGGPLGGHVASDGEVFDVPEASTLFLGAECIGPGDIPNATEVVGDNRYTNLLSLSCNDVEYGVCADLLPDNRTYLRVGFEEDGYSSITFVSCGDGMVCVIGGNASYTQRYDVAQIIASGINYASSVVDSAEGIVSGTASGTLDCTNGTDVYIYLGGYYTVYAVNRGL